MSNISSDNDNDVWEILGVKSNLLCTPASLIVQHDNHKMSHWPPEVWEEKREVEGNM